MCVYTWRKVAYLYVGAVFTKQIGALTPYSLRFIQTERGRGIGDGDPDIIRIYTFFAASSKYGCRFKYVVRAERYNDCFAIKYYCTRNKHSEHKYSRVLDFFSSTETKRLMETCARVIPLLLSAYPGSSFAFIGSQTHDRAGYVEGPRRTQRYRIYVELVRRLFGEEVFDISQHEDSSACIFVNRSVNKDTEAARQRIYGMFAGIYDIVT